MYAVAGRDAQITGQSRFANPTTIWLEARSVLRIRKLKSRPLDVWVSDLQTQCKRKGRNPYTTKLSPMSIGLRLSSQRNGSQDGSHPCTRPRVAAKTDDRVLQPTCRLIHPDLLQRLGHIVRYGSARGLKHGLTIRRTKPHVSLFCVSLGVLTERQTLCGQNQSWNVGAQGTLWARVVARTTHAGARFSMLPFP